MLRNIGKAIAQYAYKVLYMAGILMIIGFTIYRLTSIAAPDTRKSDNSTSHVQTKEPDTDSLTSLVVKPIVESPRNQILFEGVFWFLLWILTFMLLPAGLLPLKKFKMFNLEFEIGEKEAAAIEKISENSSKALTMVNYSSEESVLRFFNEFSHVGEVEYKEALRFFLNDLVEGYREQFNTNIHFQFYEEDKLPFKYRILAEESKATKTAAVSNKLENDNPLNHNWLVHNMPEFNLATVLTSRLSPFDAMDQYLITFLHNYVDRIVENRNYAMALTELTEEDDDGQAG